MKKRIVAILLCMLWMGFIFYNSSQSGDESNIKSNIITNDIKNSIKNNVNNKYTINKTYNKKDNIQSQTSKKYNIIIRKSAHAFEYFILAILVLIALATFNINTRKSIILALCIVLIYAISDEYHQLFVNGRTSSTLDVIIDFTGGIIGVLTYHIKYAFSLALNSTCQNLNNFQD